MWVNPIVAGHAGALTTTTEPSYDENTTARGGDAIEQAVAAAEDYIGRLAREAHASAIADKRKTIMDSDIQKAREKLT